VAEKLTLELDDLVIELLSKLSRFESVNDFDSNVVDPFAAAIEAAVFGHENESEWRISELHRQKQKSLMNQIGNLQQAIIGRLPGWKSFDAGFDMPDVVGSRGGQKIIAEVKNKYNTMNSNSAAETYDKLVDFLSRDEFKGYIGVVVQIVGPLPRGCPLEAFCAWQEKRGTHRPDCYGRAPFLRNRDRRGREAASKRFQINGFDK
jgi:Eco47II restriction endonuclease